MPGTSLVRLTRAAGNAGSAGAKGARYKVTDEKILGRMDRGTRRGEFARGAKGGVKGAFIRDVVGHQQPRFRANARAGYRGAAQKQTQMSGHSASFRAGERIGAGTGRVGAGYVNHPQAVTYTAAAAIGGGVLGNDVRRARKNVKQHLDGEPVGKSASKLAFPATMAAIGGGVIGVNEAVRRGANKRGARVSAADHYVLHPYKSQYAETAAYQSARAEHLQHKADAATKPKKKARLDNRANRFRWSAASNANAGREGGLASATVGSNKAQRLNTYDRKRRYDQPKGPYTIGKSAALTPTQLRHRKRVQAGLSTAGATIGLTALGMRTGGAGARRFARDAARGERIAQSLEHKTNTALALGAGVGSLAGFNSAAISRTEGGKKPDHIHLIGKSVDPLVRQYGLRGSPQGVDREKRQQIWEARAKHLNRKRDRWDRTRQGANAVEQGGKVVAGAAGAAVAGHQLREAFAREHPQHMANAERRVASAIVAHPHRGSLRAAKVAQAAFHGKPGFKTLATIAGGSVTAAGARQLRVHAQKKARKYSSASGGIASGTAARMKDYTIGKGVGSALKRAGGLRPTMTAPYTSSVGGHVFSGQKTFRPPTWSMKAKESRRADFTSADGTTRIRENMATGGGMTRRGKAAVATAATTTGGGAVAAGEYERKKKKIGKSAFGVDDPLVSKADRRFNPAPNTKPPLYLARHTEQAVKLKALKPKLPPAGAAIRNTLRATTIGKSAFGV